MQRQIALKELRETAWIAALALVVQLYYVVGQMGISLLPWGSFSDDLIPFVGGGYTGSLAMVAIALAIALGFAQTSGESVRGTWLFLLHRPTPWWTIVGIKLLVGTLLYFATGAMPILIYALWADTPGTHASPFFWSMTMDAWLSLLAILPVYLASFLSGLRTGRWFGSRLLPLAGAGFLLFLCVRLASGWPLLALPTVAIAAWVLFVVFDVVRTRDYS